VITSPIPHLHNPYPNYNSLDYKKRYRGQHVICDGPRGPLTSSNAGDTVSAYSGVPSGWSPSGCFEECSTDHLTGFPSPVFNSFEVMSINSSLCFDRYSRLGSYGLGDVDTHPVKGWQRPAVVNWTEINWGKLQNQCIEKNKDRFRPPIEENSPWQESHGNAGRGVAGSNKRASPETLAIYKPKTAIVFRSFSGFDYTPNDIQNIRAMITELSLMSGGEYTIHLLVHIKDNGLKIFEDPEVYEEVKRRAVPQEFWEITELWNEELSDLWYPRIGETRSVLTNTQSIHLLTL
jgi:Protein of unknown function (DUF3405)